MYTVHWIVADYVGP